MIAYLFVFALAAAAQGRPNSIPVGIGVGWSPTVRHECPPSAAHFLLPHEEDCTKFYYCEYGEKWETPRDCSPGTEFNFDMQVCVHPSISDCNLVSIPVEASTVTTQSTPVSTEASIVTTQSTPASTEASTTTTQATPASTEASTTTTQATPASTEASIVSTASSVASTEAPIVSTPSSVASTEASTVTTQATPASTEASIVSTASSVASTEASIVSTPSSVASTEASIVSSVASTEASVTTTEAQIELLPNGCPVDFEIHYLLPHETNCDQFYYCNFGEKVLRNCAPGTFFNPSIQVCDWPENVNCSNPDNGADTTTETVAVTTEAESEDGWLANGCPVDWNIHQLLPHESDCGKFYQCVHGDTVERDCAAGLHFNPTLQVCDWPASAGCTAGGDGEEDNGSGDTTTVADNTEADTTTETVAVTTEAESEDGWLANGCPVDWNVHQLLPHESDCGKFYQCVHGDTVERDCAAGLHFNPNLQVCDWPVSAGCTAGGDGEEDNGSGDTTTEADNTEADTTTETVAVTTEAESEDGWLPNGCPVDWNVHQLLPHESDCGKFYQCVHGDTVERDCAAGLHFNPTLQVCDWPASAGCTAGGDGEEDNGSGDTTTVADNTEADTTTETVAVTTEAESEDGWLANGCPVDWNVHQLLPHESDCGKFYQCVHGDTVERDCAAGLHFNPNLQVCDWPVSAGCTAGGDGEEDNGSGDTTTEADNTEADTTTETVAVTTEAESEDGWLPNGCPVDWNVHQLLPHESDCGKFYQCVHGDTVERDCAAGLHFNPTLQVCDWPASAGCTAGGDGEEDNGSGDTTTVADNTEADTTTETVAVTTEAESEDGWLANGCPVDWNVHQLLPHESDCGKFYQCVHGDTVERDCAAGLHFNPNLQVCDWPVSAGCTAGGDGEEDNGSGDTTTEADNTEADTTTETVAVTTEAESEDGWLPNGCPVDWNVHQLLPHESDCGKFYQCVHGDTVERDCAAGLHFNPTLQVCDWPASAGCTAGGDGEEDNGSGDTTTVADNTEADTTTETVAVTTEAESEDGWLANGCPVDWNVHQLLPHESDCGKFYQCVHGDTVERDCAAGLHFNPTLQVCDWPASAGCTAGGDGEEDNGSGDTTTEADNTEADTTTETVAVTTEAESEDGWLPNGCPVDWNVHQLLPHESDCGKFYQCVHGDTVERDCAAGLHFNPTLQVCDWPASAGCTAGGDGEEDNGSGDTTTVADNTEADTTTETVAVTTEAESEDGWLANGCPVDWNVHQLLPHESDCGKFYQCVHGDTVERDCAAGLHFNPTLQVCDWPASAGCTAGGDGEEDNGSGDTTTVADNTEADTTTETVAVTTEAESEDGWLANGCPVDWNVHQLLPHESDCGKFYQCVHGDTVERDCAAGLHFNPTLQVCDWPASAGCTAGGDGEEDNGSGDTTTVADNTEADTTTETVAVTTEAESEDGWLANGCPVDWNVHQLLPHESDCGKFYQCVHGDTVERDCAAGLHFNPTLQVCDWPASARCTSGGDGEEDNGSGDTTTVADNTEADTTTETVAVTTEAESEDGWLANGCPVDWNVHQLLPHESDCGKFYQCVHGDTVERDCAAGLHFNPTLQVCDWPASAGCTAGGDGEEDNGSGDTTTVADNTEADTTTETVAVTTEAESEDGWLANGCPVDWNVHQLLPHESDCGKFYQCVHGDTVERDCAAGLHFNPTLQVCDWPASAGCNVGGNETTTEADNGEPTTVADNGETTTVADNGGTTTVADNTEANTTTETVAVTTEAESEDGWLANGCPVDWNIHQLLPHESDCGKFYQCVHGDTVERDCAAGLHFNPTLQVCDWPASAGCTVSTTEASIDTTTVASTDSNDDKCAEGCNVVPWAHDTDCDKYWQCDGVTAVLTVCAEGLHYNPATRTCDFICNAGCVRASAQTTLSRDGVRIFMPWDKIEPQLLEKYAITDNRN